MMLYWSIGSLSFVSIFTMWLLNQYTVIWPTPKQKLTANQDSKASHFSIPVVLVTYIGWVFGFATIAMLPIDIALSNNKNSVGTGYEG